MRQRFAICVALLCTLSSPVLAAEAGLESAVQAAARSDEEHYELKTLYASAGNAALWNNASSQAALRQALKNLESDGYRAVDADTLFTTKGLAGDVLATRTFLRAARGMAGDPKITKLIPGWHVPIPESDIVTAAAAAVRAKTLATFFTTLRPSTPAYTSLLAVYGRYTALASQAWPPISTSGARIVEIDDARMTEIKSRLVTLGDLSEAGASSEDLAKSVKRFQERHGLGSDGRIGPATLAQLNISPRARMEQIAANLAYWRLLPRTWPEHYVVVNAAAAALDVISGNQKTFSTRVITGDPAHPTPVTAATITAVTFNPPWTVPYSIATKEILPKLKRDPLYLQRNSIEIVGREDDPFGQTVDWNSLSGSRFPFQLRQRPGPENALGLVKFEMPNEFDVYLHDTPNRSLFAQNERALSHGCVRVDCARDLATHLIGDASIWLTTDLTQALEEGRTRRVPLKQPLPVFLLYFTAFVDEDGAVNFRPDIYGRDKAMRTALEMR